MAVVINHNGKNFTNIVGSRSRGGYVVTKEIKNKYEDVFVDMANLFIEEEGELIILKSETIKARIEEEYNTAYAIFEKAYDVPFLIYNKNTHALSPYEDASIEAILSNEVFGEWLAKVIFNENKYMHTIYCSHMDVGGYWGWHLSKNMTLNTLKFINDGTFSQLEALCKNLGESFFITNIGDADFTLKNAKKFHRAIELPKQVLEFLKDKEFSDLLSNFKVICAEDANEGIALVEWYNKYKNMRNVKNGLRHFKSFVTNLVDLKKKHEDISLHRLLPYLSMQRMYYCWPVEDKFELPNDELRLYRDYLNLGNVIDKYPSCLEAAHNIGVRNNDITNNPELCEKFAEVVKPLKKLEWVHDGYAIVAPTKANDFVAEGEALHHCLATYVELVANGSERVMFLRKETSKDESLITFAFDEDYKIVEAKEAFNVDVEDKKILDVFVAWRKHLKEKEKKATV